MSFEWGLFCCTVLQSLAASACSTMLAAATSPIANVTVWVYCIPGNLNMPNPVDVHFLSAVSLTCLAPVTRSSFISTGVGQSLNINGVALGVRTSRKEGGWTCWPLLARYVRWSTCDWFAMSSLVCIRGKRDSLVPWTSCYLLLNYCLHSNVCRSETGSSATDSCFEIR